MGTNMKLVITTENKSLRKLQRLRDWLRDTLGTWAGDKELLMGDGLEDRGRVIGNNSEKRKAKGIYVCNLC